MNRSRVPVVIAAAIVAGAMFGAVSSVSAETFVFTARLNSVNEVTPVAVPDQSASGLAIVALNLTRDSGGYVTAANATFDLGLARITSGSVILAHIHEGAAGVNGPVRVDSGISPSSPISLAGGDKIIVPPAVSVSPVSTANAIISNPGGFYVNIHTSASPEGAVRGQLELGPYFPTVGFGVFTNAPSYAAGDAFQIKLFAGNAGGTVSADLYAGLALPPQPTCAVPLAFLGPNGTFAAECFANLASPGSHAIPLGRGLSIPSLPLGEYTLFSTSVPTGVPAGTYSAFFCLATPNTFPNGPITCETSPFVRLGH